jgi:putative ABC transport system permease protein
MRTALVAAWHRLYALILRRRLERDLDEEVAFHLSMREAEYRAAGAPPSEAHDAARRRFGNVTHVKEEMRDMWTFPSFESIRQDVRYALRALGRAPGFTAVAIAALAIGIGGNTAIFSLVDALRAGALPFREADRLVELWGNVQRASVERRGASYPDYLDWRAQSRSFEDVAAFDSQWLTLAGTDADEPERMLTEFVSSPYFSLLGVAPARGRVFRDDEDLVSKPSQVVVLSDGLWKRRFDADPNVVGRTVTLCCAPRQYTVVGVMPPGFKGVSDTAELWVPFATYASPSVMAERGSRGFAALARLKPGVTLRAAQADMDAISRRLEQAYPDTNEKRAVELSPLDVELFGDIRPALLALMAAVAFVLLIACANVANLLIARSEARRREIAVRTALGAGRGRLLRQFITESCVLTFMGAVAGLLLARVAVAMLLARSPVTFPSFVTPGLDLRVALFTVAVSVACGIVVGLVPGSRGDARDLSGSLKESARSSGGRESQRLRGVLVVVEVSVAVVLLVGAGLMIRSVQNLAALDPGFDPHGVLAVHASIPRVASRPAVEGRVLLDRLRAIPGVAAAALSNGLPLDGDGGATFYSAEGQPDSTVQNRPRIYVHVVTPELFSTLKIPIVAGRTFAQAEMSSPSQAAIVSENVVKRFWPGQDPVGKRVKFGSLASNNPWLTIVGVVPDVKYRGLPRNPTADPDIYIPFADRNSLVAIALRTTVPPASMIAPVRAAIRAADRSIAVYNVATMDDLVRGQMSRSRFTMWLMGLFAGVALLLASVGIYGVMSYLVTQRTQEIGIRLALGANRRDILRLIVGNGMRLIGTGIAIGIGASLALARLVTTLLFGVTGVDTASGLAIAVLAIVSLAACYLPALRASRVDPLRALRYE